MAAGISNTLWSMNDIVALIDVKESMQDRSRGKYNTKNQISINKPRKIINRLVSHD